MTQVASPAPVLTRLGALVRAARGSRPLTSLSGDQLANSGAVDITALAEQVVGDAVSSAFDSAGQRCSALRVLCVQEEAADRVVEMLQGAMGELRVGNPGALRVDVGPVIDAEAQAGISQHIDTFKAKGHRVFQHPSGADMRELRPGLPTSEQPH